MFLRHLDPLKGALERFCHRELHDRSASQDVLQTAIAAAYRDFDLYSQGTNFRAWIFRYVHLEILTQNRRILRQGRRHELPATLPERERVSLPLPGPLYRALLDDPDAVLEHCDEVLAEAIRALEPQERSVLLLQSIGEFKYREIADILSVPIGTVMSSLARCRTRLRQQLVNYGKEKGFLADVPPDGPASDYTADGPGSAPERGGS